MLPAGMLNITAESYVLRVGKTADISWDEESTQMKKLMFEGMCLRHKIRLYTASELKVFASDLGLKGYSKLKKDELVGIICERLLDPNVMFYRMSIFDDKALRTFEKGIGGFYKWNTTEFNDVCIFNEMDYAASGGGVFYVFDDVARVWKSVRNKKFETYRKKASWVWKCLYWTEEMYGYTPIENFLDVINARKGFHMTEAELIDIFDHFPEDRLWTIRFDDIFVSALFVDAPDALRELRIRQGAKEFYIPSASEVEEFFETGALLSTPEYRDMQRFVESEFGLPEEKAEDILRDLWHKITEDDDPHETMQWYWNQFEFDGEVQVNRIVNLYMQLMNGTRMRMNRGFTPKEMHFKNPVKPGTASTIMAGSSLAAKMLKEAAPDLEKAGFKIDLDSNAGTVSGINMQGGAEFTGEMGPQMQKKVYPNDPCPCGSGKKYKKCCGRDGSIRLRSNQG